MASLDWQTGVSPQSDREEKPVEEAEAGFRPVQSLYFWPLSGAFALTAFLCIVSLLQALRLRRIRGAQTHAG